MTVNINQTSFGDLQAARDSLDPVYKDTEGKPLKACFTKQEWSRLDKLTTKKSTTRLTMTKSQQILSQQMHSFESLFRTSIIFRDFMRLSYYVERLAATVRL